MTVDELRVSQIPQTKELWKWSATQLAQGIRTRAISSREAVASCLDRIAQVNPNLNAVVEVQIEEALHAADAADRAVSNGEELGLLHGVPIATKINSDQKGLATTDGVVAFRDQIAAIDCPPIANLRRAGSVIVGRTNVPAFSLRWFSNNDLHGRTLNPWDPGRTPGGSSGGASSAVASGMVPVAHGNDIAGSIRYPAYACGVMGIRPTMGRVPSWDAPPGADQSLAVQAMVAQGPLARTVADLRLALAAMSDFDPRDPIHAQVPLNGAPLQHPVRVGVLRDVGVAKLDSSGHEALDTAAEYLRNAGYVVDEVEVPLFAEAYRLWLLLVLEDLRTIMPVIDQFGDKAVKMNLEYNYEVSRDMWGKCSLEQYKQGYARRGTLIAQLQDFLQAYPLLMLPVSSEPAFKHDEDIESLDSNRRLVAAQWPMMSVPLLGFPAMSVPLSVVDGLPTGVQILGRRFREDTIFDAAEVIEAQVHTLTPIDPKH